MTKTLREMTDEIREINVAKGWRPAEGGPGTNTWGDYVALLHSELSEVLEAFRDWGLADATAVKDKVISQHPLGVLSKPEGVGSEFADVLIRLLDMCDVFGVVVFDLDMQLGDVAPVDRMDTARPVIHSFGDRVAWLHHLADVMWVSPIDGAPGMLRALVTVSEFYSIDLDAEYERKVAFNRTRPFKHGGRSL